MADELTFPQRAAAWPAQLKNYFDELHTEMKRVTWPPWKQVRATTVVVILAVFAFAGYFMVVDTVVNAGITKIVNMFSK
jgi:preprotein translocase subunit SecE